MSAPTAALAAERAERGRSAGSRVPSVPKCHPHQSPSVIHISPQGPLTSVPKCHRLRLAWPGRWRGRCRGAVGSCFALGLLTPRARRADLPPCVAGPRWAGGGFLLENRSSQAEDQATLRPGSQAVSPCPHAYAGRPSVGRVCPGHPPPMWALLVRSSLPGARAPSAVRKARAAFAGLGSASAEGRPPGSACGALCASPSPGLLLLCGRFPVTLGDILCDTAAVPSPSGPHVHCMRTALPLVFSPASPRSDRGLSCRGLPWTLVPACAADLPGLVPVRSH